MYGTAINQAKSVKEWQEASGIIWDVKESPVEFVVDEGMETIKNRKVLYRSDNNYPLGIMSNRYQTFQPAEVFEFFKEVIDIFNVFVPEACGIAAKGKKIWAIAKSKGTPYDFGGDVVKSYLLVATSFDRSMPTIIQPTSVRMFCANQLNYILKSENVGRYRVKHFQEANLAEIKKNLNIDSHWLIFGERIEKMISTEIKDDKVTEFYKDVLGLTGEERDRKNRVINHLMESYHTSPGNEHKTAKGTVWGVVNGVSYYTDHLAGRSEDKRIDSAMFGQRSRLKEVAFEKALELVG